MEKRALNFQRQDGSALNNTHYFSFCLSEKWYDYYLIIQNYKTR